MKNIQKNGCPPNYVQWCKKVAGTDGEHFQEIPKSEKQELMDTLLAEQGFLCGYTMKRIDEDTAHIEHIKPESLCRSEKKGSDLNYRNLIACYPKKDRKDKNGKYRYGARKKEDWWDNDGKEFVSPLDPECESLFHFDLKGNITASNVAAATTIKVLALDNMSLTEDRKRVIEEFIYGPNKKDPISPADANRTLSHICNQQNGQGCYNEFCVAIRDALKQYVNFLEIIGRQKRSSRRKS
jgi:uncharacterized protein (TIGR02646 family)